IHILFPDLVFQKESAISSIVKRTYHTCNIPQRRTLKSSLTITTCRLSFKIEDHKILSCKQDLSQVIIAMNTGFYHINFLSVYTLIGIKNIRSQRQNILNFFSQLL